METIRLGKSGTLVMPEKLREQFGLQDGSLLAIEARNGEIHLRPAVTAEVEVYTPERQAEFHLNNAISKEDWDDAASHIRQMDLDPLNIPNTDPGKRETLPTNAELSLLFDRIDARLSARKIA